MVGAIVKIEVGDTTGDVDGEGRLLLRLVVEVGAIVKVGDTKLAGSSVVKVGVTDCVALGR